MPGGFVNDVRRGRVFDMMDLAHVARDHEHLVGLKLHERRRRNESVHRHGAPPNLCQDIVHLLDARDALERDAGVEQALKVNFVCVFFEKENVLSHDESPDSVIDQRVIVVALIDRELKQMLWCCGDCRVVQADTAGFFHRHPPLPVKIWLVCRAGKGDSVSVVAGVPPAFRLIVQPTRLPLQNLSDILEKRPYLENDYRVADADEVFDARGVPVGQADAAVAGGAADRLRIVRAVDADTGLVQTYPENAHEIIRPGRKVEVILGAHAVIEHAFVVAKPRHRRHAENLPRANRRGKSCRSGCDRKDADQLVAIEDFEQPFFCIDKNFARGKCRIFRNFSLSEFFDLEWQHVRHFEDFARLQLLPIFTGIQFLNVRLGGMITLCHKFEQRRIRQPF